MFQQQLTILIVVSARLQSDAGFDAAVNYILPVVTSGWKQRAQVQDMHKQTE